VAGQIKKRDKWYFLTLGARWDRAVVPIYEAAARGKCVPLLKTLLTSHCKNECAYCAFRAGRKCLRTSWEPEKLAKITMYLWSQGRIRGLFLSSSVAKDPDYITERQLEVLGLLRKMGYTGYIHLRIMPGRLEWITEEIQSLRKKKQFLGFGFGKAGIDTQIIVGATEDNDLQHLKTTEWLYRKMRLKRVYYSGFEPIKQTPLENRPSCPPWREYRLYQASFLIRDYGITAKELEQIMDEQGFLPNVDPKIMLARIHREIFPVDLNTASFKEIIRIPHTGPITARKIIEYRKIKPIRYLSDLEKILGSNLARKVLKYVDIKDRQLAQFQNNY